MPPGAAPEPGKPSADQPPGESPRRRSGAASGAQRAIAAAARHVRQWLRRLPSSQTLWFGAIAAILGLTTGIGVWVFKQAINLIQAGATRITEHLGQAA